MTSLGSELCLPRCARSTRSWWRSGRRRNGSLRGELLVRVSQSTQLGSDLQQHVQNVGVERRDLIVAGADRGDVSTQAAGRAPALLLLEVRARIQIGQLEHRSKVGVERDERLGEHVGARDSL